MIDGPRKRRDATEDLINAYEAEEERILHTLIRKLEQLREEKAAIQNAMEAESESQVHRLVREIEDLKRQLTSSSSNSSSSSPTTSSTNGYGTTGMEALQRENVELRQRLMDMERDYSRMMRLNEEYREELIGFRRRMGIPLDDIVGITPFPSPKGKERVGSPVPPITTTHQHQDVPTRASTSTPQPISIPRSSSAHHLSFSSTASSSFSSTSSASTSSSFNFNPYSEGSEGENDEDDEEGGGRLNSIQTNQTSPPSPPTMARVGGRVGGMALTYPSVPPPSLSSSFATQDEHDDSEDIASNGLLMMRAGAMRAERREGSMTRREASMTRRERSATRRERSESRPPQQQRRVVETGSLARRNLDSASAD